MRKRMLALFLAGIAAACSSAASPDGGVAGSTLKPDPSELGRLTVRPDSGAAIVGRRLHVLVTGVDASGLPIDVSSTELASTNPAVAQLSSAVAVPSGTPPATVYNLSATFDLTASGSTAIRARLGHLSDSVVIAVIPPP